MMNSPVLFMLPRSCQPAEFLPPRLLTRADDARWLVSTIVRKMAARDLDSWGLARLHTSVMRRVIVADRVAEIVKALESGGAIEIGSHYYPSVKCCRYRLTNRFMDDRSIQVPAADPIFLARFKAEQDRQRADQQARWQPIHHALDREQRALTITDDADRILDTLPEHTRLCQHVLVSRIQRRQFRFSVSRTGRCFNAASGLKRDLRPALRLDGGVMGSVDIVNAQPALLAMMMHPAPP